MKGLLKFIVTVSLLLGYLGVMADSRKDFIRKYRHIAVREMERTGIPASISLAQGILESGCGASELAVKANNHFGIKCHNEWQGPTYIMDDDQKNECFRKYKNPEQSWIDHSDFLTSRSRYAGLFNLKTTDYKAWAKGLKAAGYATNPQYAHLLIKIIEEEELYKYDRHIKHPTGGALPRTAGNKPSPKTVPPTPPDPANYHKREEMRNGITCIEATSGDSYDEIANYYNIKIKKLLKYNDKTDTELNAGELVYLKQKKAKAARGYEFHRVKTGDDLYRISQSYGVRLKSLLRYNYLRADSPLTEGEKIFLRKKIDLY